MKHTSVIRYPLRPVRATASSQRMMIWKVLTVPASWTKCKMRSLIVMPATTMESRTLLRLSPSTVSVVRSSKLILTKSTSTCKVKTN